MTRANTPASASFRLFLLFSPWRASARLRLKNQKSLENPSLAGAKQFCRSEMCPDKERPAENTAVLSRDLTQYGRISVRQNRVCPCQLMVSILSIPSSRFRRTPMFSVYPSICLASSGYNSLYSCLFSGYGIQKLSFQGVRVVSHRRGLLEIPLKAKLPIFSNCQVFF